MEYSIGWYLFFISNNYNKITVNKGWYPTRLKNNPSYYLLRLFKKILQHTCTNIQENNQKLVEIIFCKMTNEGQLIV